MDYNQVRKINKQSRPAKSLVKGGGRKWTFCHDRHNLSSGNWIMMAFVGVHFRDIGWFGNTVINLFL